MASEDIFSEGTGGSGPGFILGVLAGTIAGAAAATLFAPTSGQEIRHRITEEAAPLMSQNEASGAGARPEAALARARTLLDGLRTRVKHATEEGRQAAQEAEEQMRGRFSDLTQG